MGELGIALLAKLGVRLLTASGDDLTDSNDLGCKMMRQVAGAFMEYEKGCQTAQWSRAQAQGWLVRENAMPWAAPVGIRSTLNQKGGTRLKSLPGRRL